MNVQNPFAWHIGSVLSACLPPDLVLSPYLKNWHSSQRNVPCSLKRNIFAYDIPFTFSSYLFFILAIVSLSKCRSNTILPENSSWTHQLEVIFSTFCLHVLFQYFHCKTYHIVNTYIPTILHRIKTWTSLGLILFKDFIHN